MIKRPINPQFSAAVLEGRKITTIREKPWPVGVPIMLYCWSGIPYRSKQVDVASVIVEFVQRIDITHDPMGARFSTAYVANRTLFSTEGFANHREMEQWFEAIIRPGQTVTKHLMRFRLNAQVELPPEGREPLRMTQEQADRLERWRAKGVSPKITVANLFDAIREGSIPPCPSDETACSALTRVAKMSNEEIQRAIDATHPETLDTSRSMAADQLAMMLIHNRHGKREIVNLIRWLLLDSPNVRPLAPADTQAPKQNGTL